MSNEAIEEDLVLMVIDRENVLIHVGQPEAFKKKVLVEYARKGYTMKTVTFKEWKELNLALYEKVKVKINDHA